MSESRPDLKPGDKIGKYEILDELASGDIGVVYLAEQRLIKRKVAITLNVTKDEEAMAQVRRASEIMASIDHPNIIGLHDVDEYEGYLYQVARFIDGKTLSQMVESGDELSLTVALKLMISIADALDYLHGIGIIHGDIKPPNIIVRGGNPFIVDLNISGLAEDDLLAGKIVGTPPYMAPEVWRGRRDTRSDLWALGMTLHYLFTGRFPFEVTHEEQMAQIVTSEALLDTSGLREFVPEPVARIVERCLEKELDKRYQSAADVRRDLESALAYVESGQYERAMTVAPTLRAGSTILLNVDYREPGIPGQYREYQIEEEVGAGAFSIVYRATDSIGERKVALKVLRQEIAQSENTLIRFQREARLLARLNHPNIVRVYNFGRYGVDFFIVMELLGDLTVRRAMDSGLQLEVEQAVAVTAQVLLGLERIHAEGTVHRDIKPGNVMLQPDRAVVMDLGIAHIRGETQLTVAGEIVGTPLYMAPEQVRGQKVAFQSDVYGTGVLLYEMLTGRTPHEADTMTRLVFSIASEEPEPITKHRGDLPPPLVSFLDRSLAREPANRFQSTRLAYEELLASVGLREDEVPAIQRGVFSALQERLSQ